MPTSGSIIDFGQTFPFMLINHLSLTPFQQASIKSFQMVSLARVKFTCQLLMV